MNRRSLVIIITIIAFMCCTVTAGVSAQEPAKGINALSASFGTGVYLLLTAMEKMAAGHPKIRISHAESPGAIYNTKIMATLPDAKKRWQNTVFISTPIAVGLAKKGTADFEKPLPVVDDFRCVINMIAFGMALNTFDSKLTDAKDLGDANIALGKRGQSGYGWLPPFILKEAYGLEPKVDYLGPKEAITALLDGRVDVAVNGVFLSSDFSVVKPGPPTVELEASGRKFYWVRFDSKRIKAAMNKAGFGAIEIIKVPANTLPQQPEPLTMVAYSVSIMAHKSFPEDLAYEFTKLALDNWQNFKKYAGVGAVTTPATMAWGWPKEQFHPGAIRAHKRYGKWAE